MIIKDSIFALFKNKAKSNSLFTTLEMSNSFKSVPFPHVQAALNSLWREGSVSRLNYTRTLKLMREEAASGPMMEVYVYHPNKVSPNEYTYPPAASVDHNVGHFEPDTVPAVLTRHLTKGVRKDGAIELPQILISQMKPVSDSLVYAVFEGGELIVSGKKRNESMAFKVYKTGEARIPKKMVDEYFPTRTKINIRVMDSELRIS